MPTKVLLYGLTTMCVDGAEFALNDSPLTQCVGRARDIVQLARFAASDIAVDAIVVSAHYRQAPQLLTDIADCQRMFSGAHVVVFGCMLDDPTLSIQIAALGAAGLPNPLRLAGFAGQLISALANPSVNAGKAARRVIGRPHKLASRVSNPNDLSAREIEILTLLTEGLKNATIAQQLNVSERTVKNHLYRIYQKLDVSSRGQAAVEALRRGLLPS